MKDNSFPKISVLVITYNQEDVIRRALDSLISQKDYLYEICVNDDCSTDNTWKILQEYEAKYPDLVKPVQNKQNLFIFANEEASWKRPTGDLIYKLSGDDEAAADYFRHVISFIKEKDIDYKNEKFCIYGNYKLINSNGSFIIYKNNLINDHNAIKLKTRKLVSGRSACFSRKLLERFEPVSQGRSYMVESAQDCQLQLYSEHNYYIPFLGNIYYAQIGVSAHMNRNETYDNTIKCSDFYLEFLKKHNYEMDRHDLNYIKYMKAYRNKNYFKALFYYLCSIDPSLGFEGLQLNRIFFVIKNKIS